MKSAWDDTEVSMIDFSKRFHVSGKQCRALESIWGPKAKILHGSLGAINYAKKRDRLKRRSQLRRNAQILALAEAS